MQLWLLQCPPGLGAITCKREDIQQRGKSKYSRVTVAVLLRSSCNWFGKQIGKPTKENRRLCTLFVENELWKTPMKRTRLAYLVLLLQWSILLRFCLQLHLQRAALSELVYSLQVGVDSVKVVQCEFPVFSIGISYIREEYPFHVLRAQNTHQNQMRCHRQLTSTTTVNFWIYLWTFARSAKTEVKRFRTHWIIVPYPVGRSEEESFTQTFEHINKFRARMELDMD